MTVHLQDFRATDLELAQIGRRKKNSRNSDFHNYEVVHQNQQQYQHQQQPAGVFDPNQNCSYSNHIPSDDYSEDHSINYNFNNAYRRCSTSSSSSSSIPSANSSAVSSGRSSLISNDSRIGVASWRSSYDQGQFYKISPDIQYNTHSGNVMDNVYLIEQQHYLQQQHVNDGEIGRQSRTSIVSRQSQSQSQGYQSQDEIENDYFQRQLRQQAHEKWALWIAQPQGQPQSQSQRRQSREINVNMNSNRNSINSNFPQWEQGWALTLGGSCTDSQPQDALSMNVYSQALPGEVSSSSSTSTSTSVSRSSQSSEISDQGEEWIHNPKSIRVKPKANFSGQQSQQQYWARENSGQGSKKRCLFITIWIAFALAATLFVILAFATDFCECGCIKGSASKWSSQIGQHRGGKNKNDKTKSKNEDQYTSNDKRGNSQSGKKRSRTRGSRLNYDSDCDNEQHGDCDDLVDYQSNLSDRNSNKNKDLGGPQTQQSSSTSQLQQQFGTGAVLRTNSWLSRDPSAAFNTVDGSEHGDKDSNTSNQNWNQDSGTVDDEEKWRPTDWTWTWSGGGVDVGGGLGLDQQQAQDQFQGGGGGPNQKGEDIPDEIDNKEREKKIAETRSSLQHETAQLQKLKSTFPLLSLALKQDEFTNVKQLQSSNSKSNAHPYSFVSVLQTQEQFQNKCVHKQDQTTKFHIPSLPRVMQSLQHFADGTDSDLTKMRKSTDFSKKEWADKQQKLLELHKKLTRDWYSLAEDGDYKQQIWHGLEWLSWLIKWTFAGPNFEHGQKMYVEFFKKIDYSASQDKKDTSNGKDAQFSFTRTDNLVSLLDLVKQIYPKRAAELSALKSINDEIKAVDEWLNPNKQDGRFQKVVSNSNQTKNLDQVWTEIAEDYIQIHSKGKGKESWESEITSGREFTKLPLYKQVMVEINKYDYENPESNSKTKSNSVSLSDALKNLIAEWLGSKEVLNKVEDYYAKLQSFDNFKKKDGEMADECIAQVVEYWNSRFGKDSSGVGVVYKELQKGNKLSTVTKQVRDEIQQQEKMIERLKTELKKLL